VNLFDTGSGRVLLAFQPRARRDEMLREHELADGEAAVDEPALDALLD
jgi:DNA-binding IclR family transcriptional regulator